jgi:transcriptional regulator with XRE-family HTH domain
MGAWSLHSRPMAMSPHDPSGGNPQKTDWEADLIHDLGKWTRKVREFLNFSQDRLAKLAGVSQGAVSRVEAGRGKATPLLTFTKINQVFAKALSELDPAMLSDEARAMLDRARYMAKPVPEERQTSLLMLVDPVLTRLISTYQTLPERERRGFLSVLDATASSLSRHPMTESPVERAARTPH